MPKINSYSLAPGFRLARFFLRPLFRGLFRLLAEIQVDGLENIPRGTPYLAALNHVSVFDPPFALTFWPENIEVLGASDIWNRSGFGQNILVRLYGAIPVHRGAYDRQALEQVSAVLRSGHALLMSPEGGRTHVSAMRRARPGVAFILEAAGVPVLPVAVIGTADDFFQRAIRGGRPRLILRVGRPFSVPALSGRGEERRLARQQIADLVMSHIAGLLPADYRGVYAESAIEP
ncbi:MAG: lysophospholipid acyltransferase family protein [Anaerolineales bacterium]